MMTTNNNNLMWVDPRLLIVHPLKRELQTKIQDKPDNAKDAMENAWKQIPNQVVPVHITHCMVNGVKVLALLDGEVRGEKAIHNNVSKIPAVYVDTDGMTDLEIMKLIITPNHSFHLSLFEIGMAASRLYREVAVGQGIRNKTAIGYDPDGEVAGILGHGLKSGRVKKCRLVFEADPDLLRKVDNKELKSLAAAYNTIKKTRIKPLDSYSDGDEITISPIGGAEAGVDTPTLLKSETNQLEQHDLVANPGVQDSMAPTPSKEEYLVKRSEKPYRLSIEIEADQREFLFKCPCCKEETEILINQNITL